MDINSILCVCTGNICRSPLAQRLLAQALPKVTVASAGIGALPGEPMAPAAATIAARESLEPMQHEGRQFTADMVQQFELILVMEQGQKKWIEERYPQSAGRVFMLTHWQGGADIRDPYRLPDDVFEAVFQQMVTCTEQWRQRLN